MKIDYLFIGIARGDRNDYRELYRLTKNTVYAVALSHVRDKTLAREITVETYRRVWMYAYSYNTDMDGELWLMEIARNLSVNAMLDKKFKQESDKQLTDNLSKLLIDIILNLDNDRGKIILLSSLSDLPSKDLAAFLWYKPSVLKSEYREGIKQLEKTDTLYSELDIPATVRDNFPEAVPDMWELINSDDKTALAFTSHEVLDLTEEEYSFGKEEAGQEENAENGNDTLRRNITKAKKKKRLLAVIAAGLCFLAAGGIITAIILSNTPDTKKDNTDYSQYLSSAQYNTKLPVDAENNTVCFSNPLENYALYSVTVSENGTLGTPEKAVNISAKDFVISEGKIYYRSLTDGNIYRAEISGENNSPFSDRAGSVLAKAPDFLYFSGTSGICRIPFTGGESELVYDCSADENLERYDIEISSSGRVFFSAGAWGGIHCLTKWNEETSIDTLFLEEAYSLQSENGRLYFSYLGTKGLSIYYFDENSLEKKEPHIIEGIQPGTGAFYVSGDYVYYEGYVTGATGITGQGVYRISRDGGTPEQLFSYEVTDKMYISDLFVSGNILFCYYSGGEKNGPLKLETRLIDNPGTVQSVLFG